MEDYLKIEEKYAPLIKLFKNNVFLSELKYRYKGFITAQNGFVNNPKILFIGINPGSGAYNEINKGSRKDIKYPQRLFLENKIEKLDWLKKGNAYGYFDQKNGKWNPFEWYDELPNKKINNPFVKRMVDFLFNYYDLQERFDFVNIEESINSEIFYWNLYPIATKTTKELDYILKRITEKRIILNDKEITSLSELRNFFRQRTIDLIDLIKPEVIVCLGKQSFKELSFSSEKIDTAEVTKLYTKRLRRNDQIEHNIFVVSRSGNWGEKIKKLGKHLNRFHM